MCYNHAMMIRTVTRTAKVSRPTHIRLDAFLRQQNDLWNGALQERRDCYEKTGRSISLYEQFGPLAEIRRNPEFSQFDRRTLKQLQRKVARAEKGKNNQRKKVMALWGECERVRIIEHNELHRAISEIVKYNNCIVVENLQIDNMARNHSLARAIMKQQWGRFVNLLTYKAESAGEEVIRVVPHHTSTDCSVCSSIAEAAVCHWTGM